MSKKNTTFAAGLDKNGLFIEHTTAYLGAVEAVRADDGNLVARGQ
jgi:hypothetical protein